MLNLSFYEWAYVASASFQLSGAVLLLIKYCFLPVAKEIEENILKETHVEDEILVMGRTQPTASEVRENVHLNRAALLLLSAGYLLCAWGDVSNEHRFFAFAWIVIISSALTVLCYYTAKKNAVRGNAN